MRLEQFLTEDVSKETSIKTIVDVLSTELPEFYRKLAKMAERYHEGHGELGRGFRFVSGGQKTQWYHDVFVKYLRASLYNLANHTKSDELKEYLSSTIGNASFSEIENKLLGILHHIASKNKIDVLSKAVSTVTNAKSAYYNKLDNLEISGDDDDDEPKPKEPSAPNPIALQNAAVEAVVNDVLSRIDRRHAGEIRQILARSGNKLQTLQQELTRRNLNP